MQMATQTQILIAHPDVLQIAKDQAGTEVYSKLLTLKPFSKGQTIAKIENVTYTGSKKWSTIQIGKKMHAEINDELVCMNHSCNPSVIVDVQSMEVKANRDLVPGDELTFFYPSTEWKMASPFVCTCDSPQCLQVIAGAEHIPIGRLKKYHINQHIVEMITELLAATNPHIVLEHKEDQ